MTTVKATTMKAMVLTKYGSLENFQSRMVPVPELAPTQVRVRVVASALNPADYKVALGTLKFLHGRKFPMILGYDFSGVVEETGAQAQNFKKGDEVFGFVAYSPTNNRGALAEFVVGEVSEMALKPKEVSHELAAASATPALTALQSLRNLGRIAKGSRIAVTGVSGGVGSLAVSIGQRMGCEVTAIGSGAGLALAKSLGATVIVDRKKGDPFQQLSGPYDVIFDAAGVYRWKQFKKFLKPGGAFVTTLPSLGFFQDKLTSLLAGSRAEFINVKARSEDLGLIGKWLSEGMTVTIGKTIGANQVSEGLAALVAGQVTGRVVVQVANRLG